jgi:hypothetical protein
VRAALVVGLCAWAACGPKAARTGVTESDAIVYLKSNVRDAELFVDGRDVGPLATLRGGVALVPGTHRFELRRDDYFSSYLELNLARAERKKVAMDMSPILP